MDQTTNRTIQLLRLLDDPRAREITSDADNLARTTPSWKEFQPRLGFAYDLTGDASLVIRGGYGLFYDQLFQNLTLFSMTQSGLEFYAEVMRLTNNSVGVGQIPNFRYGVDPPPPTFGALPPGTFGRINHPDASDPYVQKASIGARFEFGAAGEFAFFVVFSGRMAPHMHDRLVGDHGRQTVGADRSAQIRLRRDGTRDEWLVSRPQPQELARVC